MSEFGQDALSVAVERAPGGACVLTVFEQGRGASVELSREAAQYVASLLTTVADQRNDGDGAPALGVPAALTKEDLDCPDHLWPG